MAAAPKPDSKGLRPGLRWALGLSTVASAWALFSPADGNVTPAVTHAAAAPGPDAIEADTVAAPAPAANRKPLVAPPPPLPSRLPALALEAADRDPFMIPAPPAPPAPPPPPPPPPPPAPTAPPLAYRYLGTMVAPDGSRKVYLAKADKDFLVEVGTRLDEGYRVDAITDAEIQLLYEPLQQRVVIRIPAASPTP